MANNPGNKPIGGPLAMLGVMVALVAVLVGGMWWATKGPVPQSRSTTSTPPPSPTAGLTPAQLLATGAGLDKNDPEIAAAYNRLDAACPENGEFVADIATNFKALVKKETGNDYPIAFLMDKLSEVQEGTGSQQECVETGAMLALVAGEW